MNGNLTQKNKNFEHVSDGRIHAYENTGDTRDNTYIVSCFYKNIEYKSNECIMIQKGKKEEEPCNLSVSPTAVTIDSDGGNGSISVTSSTNFSASSNVSWITVTTATSKVNYTIDKNTSTDERTGTIKIWNDCDSTGKTVSVKQTNPSLTRTVKIVMDTSTIGYLSQVTNDCGLPTTGKDNFGQMLYYVRYTNKDNKVIRDEWDWGKYATDFSDKVFEAYIGSTFYADISFNGSCGKIFSYCYVNNVKVEATHADFQIEEDKDYVVKIAFKLNS